MKERQSLVRATAQRYQRAPKKEKGKILDEFIKSTSYTRCYGSYLLSRHGRPRQIDSKTALIGDVSKRMRKKRDPVYGPEVVRALKVVWINLDFLCGKRLKAALGETVSVLEKWNEIKVSAETRRKLEQISAATIDRLLASERKRVGVKVQIGD